MEEENHLEENKPDIEIVNPTDVKPKFNVKEIAFWVMFVFVIVCLIALWLYETRYNSLIAAYNKCVSVAQMCGFGGKLA